MSFYKYQATIMYGSYPAVVTVEARNDREGLAKLTAHAVERHLLTNTITRDGKNLREEYRRRRANNEIPPAKKRQPARRRPRKHH